MIQDTKKRYFAVFVLLVGAAITAAYMDDADVRSIGTGLIAIGGFLTVYLSRKRGSENR